MGHDRQFHIFLSRNLGPPCRRGTKNGQRPIDAQGLARDFVALAADPGIVAVTAPSPAAVAS